MAADFTGKTALITGAGRGIGRAIALGLADGGATAARPDGMVARTQWLHGPVLAVLDDPLAADVAGQVGRPGAVIEMHGSGGPDGF